MYDETDIFEEIFYMELDSWFAVSHFVCDYCVENFKDNWRGIIVNDKSFERNSMPLDYLYKGSKILCQRYSLSKYRSLVKKIKCYHCGGCLSENIWPYDLPEGAEEYINEMDQIAELSKKAPFMILTHPFANRILTFLKEIFEKTSDEIINTPVYRCRIPKEGIPYGIEESGVVPDNKAEEGRFNHSGYGFLYLATTRELAFLEVAPNQEISVSMATINILKKLRILNLTNIEAYNSDIYRAIMASSNFFNPPGGKEWDKPGYVLPRFIADCAIYLGFEGIIYNSQHSSIGSNLVIFKDKANKNFNWDNIYKIKQINIYQYKG